MTSAASHAQSGETPRSSCSIPIAVDLDTLNRRLNLVSASEKLPTLFLSQNGERPEGRFRSFCTDTLIHYDSLCDDFGPMNMLSVIKFVQTLDEEVCRCLKCGCEQLVYLTTNGRRAFTNAAFLVGAYIILKLNLTPEDVNTIFQGADPKVFEGYRDATYSDPDFRLRLIDCWQALDRAKSIGWIALPTTSSCPDWGKIDCEVYAHYDNPLNADLHTVVPNKFVAFRGPRDLGGPTFLNDHCKQTREFDPKYYLDIFEDLNVTTVIRLNEAVYSPTVFVNKGFEHHDLYFDDCTSPPPDIVKKFFHIVDKAKGLVAIHCKAGLGRTGTLIALYMMRTYGFSARECMGWLRIMRPGCVIGDQQHFLCKVDAALCGIAAGGRLPSSPASAASWARRASPNNILVSMRRASGVVQAADLAAQVSDGMGRRNMARARWIRSMHSSSLPDLKIRD